MDEETICPLSSGQQRCRTLRWLRLRQDETFWRQNWTFKFRFWKKVPMSSSMSVCAGRSCKWASMMEYRGHYRRMFRYVLQAHPDLTYLAPPTGFQASDQLRGVAFKVSIGRLRPFLFSLLWSAWHRRRTRQRQVGSDTTVVLQSLRRRDRLLPSAMSETVKDITSCAATWGTSRLMNFGVNIHLAPLVCTWVKSAGFLSNEHAVLRCLRLKQTPQCIMESAIDESSEVWNVVYCSFPLLSLKTALARLPVCVSESDNKIFIISLDFLLRSNFDCGFVDCTSSHCCSVRSVHSGLKSAERVSISGQFFYS